MTILLVPFIRLDLRGSRRWERVFIAAVEMKLVISPLWLKFTSLLEATDGFLDRHVADVKLLR